jgi:hypothetical protein
VRERERERERELYETIFQLEPKKKNYFSIRTQEKYVGRRVKVFDLST